MALIQLEPGETVVSPRLGILLTRIADTPDLDAALHKVLSDYLDLKVVSLHDKIRTYEAKWGMSFADFVEAPRTGNLVADPYAFGVESDFWEWEAAHTLLEHYEELRRQWM